MSGTAAPPIAIEGVSPGRDAWRRLRKSRVAMLCLWTLGDRSVAGVHHAAAAAAAAGQDRNAMKFTPPTWSPLWEKTFEFKLSDRGCRPRRDEAAIQRPYRDAGFARLNGLSRWMVRTRAQLFGEWSLASDLWPRRARPRSAFARVLGCADFARRRAGGGGRVAGDRRDVMGRWPAISAARSTT